MISPLAAQLLPTVNKPSISKGSDSPVALPSRSKSAGLADSIMQDGGLGFLRSRLDESMGALFEKAAEDNPELAATGPAAFFNASADVTPEATADRIVGFALGLKGTYSRQNSELSEAELMAGFESEIRRGIREGFGNARGILGDLDLHSGQVEENVDATWDLVQQKLAEYFHPA